MGEAARRRLSGYVRPGSQVVVDLKNAKQISCECGSKYFLNAVAVYEISALISPTGIAGMAQKPVLVCLECKKELLLVVTGVENG
jgi:DNA-directed RNA polymerase subunit RPC12/RpoP